MKKRFAKIALTSIIASPCLFTSFVASCSKQEKCEKINLYATSKVIRPGEQQQIRAVILPSGKRDNNLDWEIAEPIQGIHISDRGLVSADTTIMVTKPSTIVINGYWKKNHDIFGQIELSLLPMSTYDFQGFLNNEIQFVNRNREIESIPIINPLFTFIIGDPL